MVAAPCTCLQVTRQLDSGLRVACRCGGRRRGSWTRGPSTSTSTLGATCSWAPPGAHPCICHPASCSVHASGDQIIIVPAESDPLTRPRCACDAGARCARSRRGAAGRPSPRARGCWASWWRRRWRGPAAAPPSPSRCAPGCRTACRRTSRCARDPPPAVPSVPVPVCI